MKISRAPRLLLILDKDDACRHTRHSLHRYYGLYRARWCSYQVALLVLEPQGEKMRACPFLLKVL